MFRHPKPFAGSLWLYGLMLLNLLVKGWYLASGSIAGDEPFSIYHAQMDVGTIIRELATGNNPPLYELVLHYWIKLFGIGIFSVRLPSLLFSTLTVYFLYHIGTEFFSSRVAVVSSLLFSFSNYQIGLAHEARTYAFLGFLTAASMYFYLKSISGSLKIRTPFVLLVISNILLIYAHYFGFFVLIIQLLHFLGSPINRKGLYRPFFLGLGIVLVAYIPNGVTFIRRFIDSSSHGTWVAPPGGISSLYGMLRIFTNELVVTSLVIPLLLAAGTLFVLRNKKVYSPASRLVVLWFLFPFLFMFGISFWIPMFLDRYLMPASIGFVLLVALAADSIMEKKIWNLALPALVTLFFLITIQPNFNNKRNVRETIAKIQEMATENSLIYMCPPWFELNFRYYFDPACFQSYPTNPGEENSCACLNDQGVYPIYNWTNLDTGRFRSADKIIFLDAGANQAFPDNDILQQLAQYSNPGASFVFGDFFKVYEFIPRKE